MNMIISKYWDMRYCLRQYCMTQDKFEFYWQIGVENEADYFIKYHATVYHRNK